MVKAKPNLYSYEPLKQVPSMTDTASTASTGEQFPLPTSQDETAEFQRLQTIIVDHRAQNHEIVVVTGLGFVGTVMA
jgi:hypothetical protein